jgi:L-seryl-tRNA(Ser) seleniumtransferase
VGATVPKSPDFRSLPSVDRLAQDSALAGFSDRVRRVAVRGAVAAARTLVQNGSPAEYESILREAIVRAEGMTGVSLRPAINMSGVVLHTGLGRARLAPAAIEQVRAVASSHSVLEFDEELGGRGDRQEHVRALLQELTGAEDALVVNNGAAAVVLALSALCAGCEVLLSRGQMVEIGGSFRLPDIVGHSACKLVEVGTTNKTRLSDYSSVRTSETAAVLRCHPSNFQIVGFTEEPSASDLASFCGQNGLALIDDVGSGCLIDTARYGLPHERTLDEALKDGADVVTASGDKLLGGPQAGIVVGRKDAIKKMAKHPLARAFRIDKLTLAGIEATLRLYLDGRHEEIPVWRSISRPMEEVKRLADLVARGHKGARVEPGKTEIGGGSLPGATVPTFRVGLTGNPEDAAVRLRSRAVPVVGYIQDGTFWLDPRTADEEECAAVASYI